MSNYQQTEQQLLTYIKARPPLVILTSVERERVERMVDGLALNLQGVALYYSDAKQVCNLPFTGNCIDVDLDPLPYIAESFKKKRKLTFVLGDVKRVSDDSSYTRELLNILYIARENGGTLVLVTADTVWTQLARFGMQIVLALPRGSERNRQIRLFIDTYKTQYSIDWTEQDICIASTLLRGFSEIQIDNILSSELVEQQGLKRERIYALTSQKSRLYAGVSSIQLVEVNRNMRVSGLHGIKTWLDEKKNVFFTAEEDLKSRDLQTPKGILLAGVPGCGKSFSAKMIALQWELPLFRFDIGAVYDKWVGESEKKMREALLFLDNVAPCVVWVDEIEKALATQNEGNDTGKRVLGQFLFWLQESVSRVFLVATANDISLLPTELFRKGRFSEVFFIDLPNEQERMETIRQYAEKSLHILPSPEMMNKLCQLSQGYSYADIEYAIKDVAQLAIVHGQQIITPQLVEDKLKSVVPISQSNPEMVNKIREWGRQRAVPASISQEVHHE